MLKVLIVGNRRTLSKMFTLLSKEERSSIAISVNKSIVSSADADSISKSIEVI